MEGVEFDSKLEKKRSHFMVKKGIVLGHIVSHNRIEVDKTKIDLIANLSFATFVKDVRLFLGQLGFLSRISVKSLSS